MRRYAPATVLLCCFIVPAFASAQSTAGSSAAAVHPQPVAFVPLAPQPYSSSATAVVSDEAPDGSAAAARELAFAHYIADPNTVLRTPRPFHSIAIGPKIGIAGIGFDVATPVNAHLEIRGGAQFFNHTANANYDGLQSHGEITLQNVQASVDIFPFHRSNFHFSPGVTIHNDNHLTSYLYVTPGNVFQLGDAYYLSDPSNPINGQSRFRLGNPVAPRFTIGWGNMIPHNGGHFSIPFEIGFQYISSPTLTLQLSGNACDGMGDCGDVNDPSGAINLPQEITDINQSLSGLRFYPIMSIGFAYRFGDTGSTRVH